VSVARALHLEIDSARYDIARRERTELVAAIHERVAGEIPEDRAFAAKRFGYQKRTRSRMVETRRMELDKLEVRDLRARPISHRDPVARRGVGIRRVEVNFSGAAGRENREVRRKRFDPPATSIEYVSAQATAGARCGFSGDAVEFSFGDEIDRAVVFEKSNPRV
jgi:hypothetical protein